jgi:hypothetical protein
MDGHKTDLERLVSHGFLKGAGAQPGIVAAFGDAQSLTLTAPHANTFQADWRTLRLNQTGTASVYLINQSFLI